MVKSLGELGPRQLSVEVTNTPLQQVSRRAAFCVPRPPAAARVTRVCSCKLGKFGLPRREGAGRRRIDGKGEKEDANGQAAWGVVSVKGVFFYFCKEWFM